MSEEKKKSKFEELYYEELSRLVDFDNVKAEFNELKEFIDKMGIENTINCFVNAKGICVDGNVKFKGNSSYIEFNNDFKQQHSVDLIDYSILDKIRDNSEICIFKKVILSILYSDYDKFIECYCSNDELEEKIECKSYYVVFKNHFYFCL